MGRFVSQSFPPIDLGMIADLLRSAEWSETAAAVSHLQRLATRVRREIVPILWTLALDDDPERSFLGLAGLEQCCRQAHHDLDALERAQSTVEGQVEGVALSLSSSPNEDMMQRLRVLLRDAPQAAGKVLLAWGTGASDLASEIVEHLVGEHRSLYSVVLLRACPGHEIAAQVLEEILLEGTEEEALACLGYVMDWLDRSEVLDGILRKGARRPGSVGDIASHLVENKQCAVGNYWPLPARPAGSGASDSGR